MWPEERDPKAPPLVSDWRSPFTLAIGQSRSLRPPAPAWLLPSTPSVGQRLRSYRKWPFPGQREEEGSGPSNGLYGEGRNLHLCLGGERRGGAGWRTGDKAVMETLEEENFGVSISSPSDAEFDAVVGYLEDIIMDDDFQLIQRNFMDKYYQEFDDTEENKLIYTPIFNEYICLVEKYIEEKLLDRIPGFSMSAFILSLQQHKDEIAGDIFDMLLTFTDFLAFKEMFLDYRAEKEGRGLDLSGGLVVTPLSKPSTTSSQNSLRH